MVAKVAEWVQKAGMKTTNRTSLRKEVTRRASPMAKNNNSKLSWREAAFFVNIINSRVPLNVFTGEMREYLGICVDDAQAHFDYAASWKVSISALKDKVSGMSDSEAQAVADGIDRFWADSSRNVSQRGLALYFDIVNVNQVLPV